MLSALARRGKYRRPRQSFALVIVLAMVALLTVTLVAIYSYLTSDASLSSANENIEQARANARLALNLAVEQLQELAGPDQRVTATADILSPNGYSGVQANPYRKHWTGVWNTASYSVRTPGTKNFLGWLVSGANASGNPAMTNALALATVAPGSSDVTLVSSNTVDTASDPTHAVTAPLINVLDEKGRVIGQIAWWTGDEGVKARVNMPTPGVYASSTTTGERQNFMAAAQNVSHRQVTLNTNSDGSGANYFVNLAGTNSNLGLIRTVSQIGLLDTTGTLEAGVYENWHDITTYSQGVIADTVDGGLRLDLTSLFGNAKLQQADSTDPTSTTYGPNGAYSSGNYGTNGLEQQPMFYIPTNDIPVTSMNSARLNPVGPLWDTLARFYRYYDSWYWNGSSFESHPSSNKSPSNGSAWYFARLFPPISTYKLNAYLNTIGTPSTGAGVNGIYPYFNNLAGANNAGPVLLYFQNNYLLGANPYPSNPSNFYLVLYVQPTAVLWNPYDVPLNTSTYWVAPSLFGPLISYNVGTMGNTNIPGMLYQQNVPTQPTSYTAGFYRDDVQVGGTTGGGSYYTVTTAFAPGEVKAFSVSSYEDWDRGSGSLALPLTNVVSSTGGGYFTNTTVTNSSVPTGGWDYNLIANNSSQVFFGPWPPVSSPGNTNAATASSPVTVSVNFSCYDPLTGGSYAYGANIPVSFSDANTTFSKEWYAGAASPVYSSSAGQLFYSDWTYPLPLSTSPANYTISLSQTIEGLTNTPQPIGGIALAYQPAATNFIPSGAYNCTITSFNGSPMIATPIANSNPRALYGTAPSIASQYGSYLPGSAPFVVSVLPNTTAEGNLQGLLTSTGTWESYFGEGLDSGSGGLTHVTLFSLPSQPLISIGQFQHAPLSFHVNEPSYPIGNSRMPDYFTNYQASFTTNAPPAALYLPQFVPGTSATTKSTLKSYFADPAPIVDASWYLNNTIWDHYFLSSVPTPKQIADGFFTSTFPGQTFNNAYVSNNGPLPDSRMGYYWRNGSPPTTNMLSDYQQAAANLMINGAFNINSTSVEAWKAELASLNGGSITTTSGNVIATTGTQTPISRLIRPNDQNINGEDATLFNRWNYFTQLSDQQIQELAQNIVTQVKLRGPFSSLAEFVNRALVNVDPQQQYETRTCGALQAALNACTNTASTTAPINPLSSTQYNTANLGATTAISQGDLLQYLAPIIAARSDTFIIRAYGQSVNPVTGAVKARAWCQATVQRVPDYINSADAATNAVTIFGSWGPTWTNGIPVSSLNTSLSTTSQILGRRFRIIAFQWLNDSEL